IGSTGNDSPHRLQRTFTLRPFSRSSESVYFAWHDGQESFIARSDALNSTSVGVKSEAIFLQPLGGLVRPSADDNPCPARGRDGGLAGRARKGRRAARLRRPRTSVPQAHLRARSPPLRLGERWRRHRPGRLPPRLLRARPVRGPERVLHV